MAGEAADARRGRGQHARDIRPVEQAVLDDGGVHDGERGLEPDHAVRGRIPLALLRLDRVRRVVGRDDVDRAVGERGAQRLDVLGAAERRVHLVRGVVARDELLGEQQVVRRDLGGDGDAAGLRPADDLDGAGGRDVADVQAAPTCSASSTSRAMIDSSATAGQPASPSSPDRAPSFIWAPSVSRGSWACWAMTPSNAFTYSRARRMSSGSETQNRRR